MSKKFIVITVFFTSIGLVFQYLLTDIAGLIGGIFEMAILSCILALFGFFFHKTKKSFRFHLQRYFLIFGTIMGVLSSIIIVFSVYQNTFPGALGKITLSDGKNTIVFYQMSHIATSDFYDGIAGDLRALSSSGYIIYAEGVRAGTIENQNNFNKLLGIKLGTGTYDTIAQVIGLKAQDGTLFSGVPKSSLENVDISIDDIMNIVGTGKISPIEDSPIDIESELSIFQGKPTSFFLGYMFRGLLNFSIKSDATVDLLSGSFNSRLFDVIVGRRNSFVVNHYLSASPQKVVFVYGSLHFQGMYDLLKTQNPNWHIQAIDPIYPYRF